MRVNTLDGIVSGRGNQLISRSDLEDSKTLYSLDQFPFP